jgi:stress-induced morphogen
MHSVPKGSETHLKVLIVFEKFESLLLIQHVMLLIALSPTNYWFS